MPFQGVSGVFLRISLEIAKAIPYAIMFFFTICFVIYLEFLREIILVAPLETESEFISGNFLEHFIINSFCDFF